MNRIKAVRSTFSLMIAGIELVIGLHFLAKILDSDADWIFGAIDSAWGNSNHGTQVFIENNGIEGPVTMLVVVSALMIFGYVSIMVVVPTVKKREREEEWDFE